MNIYEEALKLHEENKGKIEVVSKTEVKDMHDLAVVYTPGVAEPCRKIHEKTSEVYKYTSKGNMVAVVSDGTAVLGLGDIGPEAALPVMEGKAVLFKHFAGVDAFPICLATKDPDKIVEAVTLIAPSFGGINLEDISAPRCFEIEDRLKKILDIPVFHDDQHGTAIVVLSGLINALKVVGKDLDNIKVVVNGAGASAIAVLKFIMSAGVKNAILCDSKGTIYEGRKENMNPVKEEMAKVTNRKMIKGALADAIVGADVFLGLSVAGA
ncbi:MAG: malic enzyme-like NAD(P)-binding protein, partial [Atribacterota bacterium]